MAEISEIVRVQISRETATVSQMGFGILNIVGESDKLPSTDIVTLTNDAAMVTGNVYAAKLNGIALAGAGLTFNTDNDTTMDAIAVIIAARAEVDTAVATDVGAVGYKNTITVTSEQDVQLEFTEVAITGGASQPDVTVAKTQALTRIRSYASLTGVADDFATTDLEYIAAEAAFSPSPRPTEIKISRKNSSGETWVEALNAIVLEDNAWYGLIVCEKYQTDVELIAGWTETKRKIFGIASNDAGIIAATTTDIAYHLQSNTYIRSFCIYHPDADGSVTDPFPDSAAFGKMFPYGPGKATWMFKPLTGVPATILTATQSANALGKNCNIYETIGGINMLREGTVGSGEYIDIIQSVDWLESRMAERIFSRLANSAKIPYTDAGIGTIEADVRAQLDEAISQGVLSANTDPDKYGGRKYSVTIPKVADISVVDRGNRLLPDIEFAATLAGAVHEVEIIGTVTV